MMDQQSIRSTTLLLLAGTFCFGLMGCAKTRSLISGFGKDRAYQQDIELQKKLASQQENAERMGSGKQSSLYPPAVVETEPVPKSEKDLKNPMQLHLSYAKLQEQLGHLTEARSSYEKVISREPKSIEANIGIGRLDALAGRHEQAEERFRRAVEMSNASPESLYTLGEYLASQKRYPEAVVELRKAANLVPKNQHYQYELGLTLVRNKNYTEALAILSEVLGEAEANYNVGYIVLKEQKDSVTAEKYLARSLQLNPDLKEARYWLAELKQRHSIMTASGTGGAEQGQVVNAVETRATTHTESEHVMSASIPTRMTADELAPEQWEQWNNQQRSNP